MHVLNKSWAFGGEDERALLEEFRNLLREMALQFSNQLNAARGEIASVQDLLQEAIDALTVSFQDMAARDMRATPESSQQAGDILGRAITALQFQDMVSQLLGHVGCRIDAMDGVMRELNTLGSTLEQEARSHDARGAIASMRQEQGRIIAALKNIEAQTINNPVDQKAMTQGDIELF